MFDGTALPPAQHRVSAVEAALRMIRPDLAADPVALQVEAAWAAREVPLNRRGSIHWSAWEVGMALRDRMTAEQGHRCCWCGARMTADRSAMMATIEHVVPLSEGGADHPDNLAVACARCNTQRARRPSIMEAAYV